MRSDYRSLLAVGEVRRLLLSSVLARLPLGICSLAILLFVRAQTGSFLLGGLAIGAYTLLSAAMAPLQGVLIDRLG
ncbi:MAG: MFS transporter, partial [Solirubrobacteraceae bacterium]